MLMEAVSSERRFALAFIAFAVGIGAFWFTKSPLGLLPPTAAVYLLAGGRVIVLLHVALAAGLIGAPLAAILSSGLSRDIAVAWTAFFAAGLCIGAIVVTRAGAAAAAVGAEAVHAFRIIESMPAFTWSADRDGHTTSVSVNTLTYAGQPVHHAGLFHRLDNAGWRRVIHPDDFERVLACRRHSLKTGMPYDMEYRVRRADGVYRWFRSYGSQSRDATGETAGWYGAMIDVEEQKQAEAALRDRERELSQLVDMVPSHLWRLTPDGEPIFFNKRMVDFLGLDVPDTVKPGMTRLEAVITTTIHPDDASTFRSNLNRCLASGESFSLRYRLRRADGAYRWMSSHAEPSRNQEGRIVQWYGLCHDIDDQMRLYSELEEREARIRRLVDSDIIGIVIWDLDGRLIEANDAFLRMVRYDREDLQGGLRWFDMTPPEWQDAHARYEAEELKATGKMQPREKEFFRKDGTRVPVLIGAACFEGQSSQGVAYILDLTERKRADGALRERERELSQLVDLVPVHIRRLTPEGEPFFFNKRSIDFFGVDVSDLEKMSEGGIANALQNFVHPDDRAYVRKTVRESLDKGEPYAMKYRIRRADGVYRWVDGRAEPVRDEGGTITQWYSVSFDIHDLITTQEALRRSERQLQQMVDAVPAMIWRTTAEGAPNYLNRRYTEVTGAVLEDLVGRDGASAPLAVVHPDDLAASTQIRARAFETGSTYVVRYRQIRRDGSYRWTETRAEPLRDESGEILQWYGVSVDIHDLITAQQALRQSEQELSQLVNMLPVHIRRLSPEGETIFFNKRLVDFIGMSLTDLDQRGMSGLAGTVQALIHPDDASRLQATIRHSLATGESYATRYRVRRADGVFRWMEGRGEPVRDTNGAIIQWYGISIDIDDEMRAQAALRERERELAQLVDIVPVYIRRLTPEGEPIFFNKRLTDFIGVDLAKIGEAGSGRLAPAVENFVHPDEAGKLLATIRHSVATGEGYAMKYRMRRADGEYRWLETRAEAVRHQDGSIAQWYVVSIDVDDEVRAQTALRERERELSQLVETLPALIFCATPKGEPTYRSGQLREFLGFNVQDKIGPDGLRLTGTLDAVIHPDDLPSVKQRYAWSLSTGEPYALKHRLRRADGAYRWVETRAVPMRNADGVIAQWNAICLDIDDQVRTQEQLNLAQQNLSRASQAASLAELSASIAHEVNQPLAAIVANSHACQRWLQSDPPNLERAKTTVERIIRDANSAADVVSRIRALFKQAIEPRSRTALDDVVAEARNLMAEEAARNRVTMEVEVERDLPLAAFDRVQLQQVLVNLIRNGIDAMGTGSGEKVLRIRVQRSGDAISAEISDQGPGVASPEKIFEAFYTTKPNGMGMGLAICRSIIESHGGRLWVESNEPRGAKFIFRLPIEAKPAT